MIYYHNNCAEILVVPTIFFNVYTICRHKTESPWRLRDLSPTWNLYFKS